MKYNLFALIVLSISTISLSAQSNFFYSDARTLSAGKAFTGLANDENAIFYNPAGLTLIQNQKVVLSGFYQEYSISDYSSYSQRGLCLQYIRNGIGISANIWGRGDWHECFGSIKIEQS